MYGFCGNFVFWVVYSQRESLQIIPSRCLQNISAQHVPLITPPPAGGAGGLGPTRKRGRGWSSSSHAISRECLAKRTTLLSLGHLTYAHIHVLQLEYSRSLLASRQYEWNLCYFRKFLNCLDYWVYINRVYWNLYLNY